MLSKKVEISTLDLEKITIGRKSYRVVKGAITMDPHTDRGIALRDLPVNALIRFPDDYTASMHIAAIQSITGKGGEVVVTFRGTQDGIIRFEKHAEIISALIGRKALANKDIEVLGALSQTRGFVIVARMWCPGKNIRDIVKRAHKEFDPMTQKLNKIEHDANTLVDRIISKTQPDNHRGDVGSQKFQGIHRHFKREKAQ